MLDFYEWLTAEIAKGQSPVAVHQNQDDFGDRIFGHRYNVVRVLTGWSLGELFIPNDLNGTADCSQCLRDAEYRVSAYKESLRVVTMRAVGDVGKGRRRYDRVLVMRGSIRSCWAKLAQYGDLSSDNRGTRVYINEEIVTVHGRGQHRYAITVEAMNGFAAKDPLLESILGGVVEAQVELDSSAQLKVQVEGQISTPSIKKGNTPFAELLKGL